MKLNEIQILVPISNVLLGQNCIHSFIYCLWLHPCCFPGGSADKESTCSAGDLGSIPGLERSPGEGKCYPLQYSGLKNSMAYIVHGVAKSWIVTTMASENVKSLSSVWLFAIPRTAACQAPLSMEFARQEYWSGFPRPSPGDFLDPGIERTLTGRFFPVCATREAHNWGHLAPKA